MSPVLHFQPGNFEGLIKGLRTSVPSQSHLGSSQDRPPRFLTAAFLNLNDYFGDRQVINTKCPIQQWIPKEAFSNALINLIQHYQLQVVKMLYR
eukprot:g67068.t1